MKAYLSFSPQEVRDGDLDLAVNAHKFTMFIHEWEQLMRSGYKHGCGRLHDAMKKDTNPEDACDSISELWHELKFELGIGELTQ